MVTVIVAGLWLAVWAVALGRRRADYSHRRDTISELGEVGARDQRLVAFGLFAPVGAAAGVVALLAESTGSRLVAASFAVGYLVAAVAPCDPGCPPRGSTRNTVHVIAGVAEYLGILVGLVVLAASVSPWHAIPAGVMALAIVGSAAAAQRGFGGAVQRAAEATAALALLVSL